MRPRSRWRAGGDGAQVSNTIQTSVLLQAAHANTALPFAQQKRARINIRARMRPPPSFYGIPEQSKQATAALPRSPRPL